MVKTKVKSKQVIRKGKKKWFRVVTPTYLNSVEIGEVTAYEPAELPGRTTCIPVKEISGSMRDSSSKIKLRIVKVQGETCQTEPLEIFVQNSQIQRIERRSKSRIITIVDGVTKDKENIRIKAYILLQNKVVRSVQTELQKIARNYIEAYIKNRELKDVFAITTPKTISNSLKTQLKTIYPVSVITWKIKRM